MSFVMRKLSDRGLGSENGECDIRRYEDTCDAATA